MKRILPEPHRYAVCAPDDLPIKEFYQDIFEKGYVFFSPIYQTYHN